MPASSLLRLRSLAILVVCLCTVSAWAGADAGKAAANNAGNRTAARRKASGTGKSSVGVSSGPATPASSPQQDTASVAPVGELRSFDIVPVAPAEYNGDVRKLPRVAIKARPRMNLQEPISRKQPPALTAIQAQPLNAPMAPMPAPTSSFDGLGFNSSCTGGQCGAGWPPDPNGDVGLNHYIQAFNDAYAIYDKAGNLLAAFTENSLWAGSGSTPCNGNSAGDPVVLYDRLADRWILTHFAFNSDPSGNPASPFYQCIAASKSGDPVSGGWWLYAVRMDTGATGQPPTNTLNDYPKFGIWTDCLYMSANGFRMPAGNFTGTVFASFSRSDLYSGVALTASLGWINNSNDPFTMIPANLLAKAPGSLPPPGTPNYFVSESMLNYTYEVRKFTAGSNCSGGTLGGATEVSQTTYTVPGTDNVPQPGTTNKLDNLGDRLMQKVQYRNVNGTESLWVVHSVQTSNNSPVAPQWAQINVTGGTIATAPVQQQIYAPDTTLYRWMGSVAADSAGNMAIGYSTSNGTAPNYPSIAYAGRLAGDPLNQLPQSETQLVAGAGSQTNTCGGNPCARWGDYTAMSVDPADDCTFWYTSQYYSSTANGASGNWSTRIGSFKFPSCVPVVPDLSVSKTHVGTFTPGQVGAAYTITVTNNGPGFTFGAITITDTLPIGLTATNLSGTGWNCTLATLTCTRADSLAEASSYPAITLIVNVAANPPASLTNTVTLSGSGDNTPANNTASDTVTLTPSAVSVTPSSGSGTTQAFTFVYSDPGGYTRLSGVFTLFNSSWNLAGACGTSYDPATNLLQLRDDPGTGYVPGGTLGSTGILQNSQCSIDLATSSAGGAGSELTVTLNITFKPAFYGTKTVYMFARNKSGLNSGWQARGTWTVPALPPAAVSVTPASGTGAAQAFTFLYSDPAGYGKLSTVYTLINSVWNLAGACGTSYDPVSKVLQLRNDTGTGYLPGAVIGAAGTLENSQCSIDLATSSASGSGSDLTVTLNITFKPAFYGNKTVYMFARNKAGLGSGWQARGTWTVPALPPAAVSVTPSSGSGITQAFTFLYSDPAGYTKLSTVFTLINSVWNLAGACGTSYDPTSKVLQLRDDTGTGYLPGGVIGAVGTIQNSQCSIDLATSSAGGAGNNLTVTLNITFKPGFTGSKTIFMFARNKAGLGSGWQARGTWTPAP